MSLASSTASHPVGQSAVATKPSISRRPWGKRAWNTDFTKRKDLKEARPPRHKYQRTVSLRHPSLLGSEQAHPEWDGKNQSFQKLSPNSSAHDQRVTVLSSPKTIVRGEVDRSGNAASRTAGSARTFPDPEGEVLSFSSTTVTGPCARAPRPVGPPGTLGQSQHQYCTKRPLL